MKFIIEHLEPKLSEWCLLEYRHISKIVGKNNLLFTNTKRRSKDLEKLGRTGAAPVSELKLKNACLLDPEAEKTLSHKDSFNYLIFGGILGDNPPQHRTAEIKVNCEKRNLGNKQMSTDTAVLVAKKITEGKKFSDFKFKDTIEIQMAENESVILPFRYLLENEKPVLAHGLVDYLKRKKSF